MTKGFFGYIIRKYFKIIRNSLRHHRERSEIEILYCVQDDVTSYNTRVEHDDAYFMVNGFYVVSKLSCGS